jgi:hypothetical protein
MHARVSSLTGSPNDVDAGVASFRDRVVPFAQEQGGKGSILLVDRATGRALAITLWEDEQALNASEEAANALRAQAAEDMGATQASPTVETIRGRSLRNLSTANSQGLRWGCRCSVSGRPRVG